MLCWMFMFGTRRLAIGASVLLAIAGAYACFRATVARQLDATGLKPISSIVDFGNINSGIQHATVTLRNNSVRPVRPIKVLTNCDCAQSRLSRNVILPGDTAELALSWDTRDKHGKSRTDLTVLYGFVGGDGNITDGSV